MDKLLISFGLLVFACLIALLLAFPTKWLWNYLMPDIFGLSTITFWQALAMNVLSAILLKSTSYNKSNG